MSHCYFLLRSVKRALRVQELELGNLVPGGLHRVRSQPLEKRVGSLGVETPAAHAVRDMLLDPNESVFVGLVSNEAEVFHHLRPRLEPVLLELELVIIV